MKENASFPKSKQGALIEAEQFAKENYADARLRLEVANLKFASGLLMHLAPKLLKGKLP